MNSPYIDLAHTVFYSEYNTKLKDDNPHKKEAFKYCMCVCSDYHILKSSIRTHEKTNKHKAMVRLIKTE